MFSGIPPNKSLYTVSYMLLSSAASGITFMALYVLVSSKCCDNRKLFQIYYLMFLLCSNDLLQWKFKVIYTTCSTMQVDVYGHRRLTSALEWMGKHSLSIFVLVSSNLAVIAIQGFYWRKPENNIVSKDIVPVASYFMFSDVLDKQLTIWFVCNFLPCRYTWSSHDFIRSNILLSHIGFARFCLSKQSVYIFIQIKVTRSGYKQTEAFMYWWLRICKSSITYSICISSDIFWDM